MDEVSAAPFFEDLHVGQVLETHLGWVASLPLGRNVAPPKGLT